jgi:uncharacterized protein (DUF169 family)
MLTVGNLIELLQKFDPDLMIAVGKPDQEGRTIPDYVHQEDEFLVID